MFLTILLSSVCLCGEAQERVSGCVLEDDNVESRAYAPFLRRYADLIGTPADADRAAGFRASLRADGSWADIDYADKSRANWWRPVEHLTPRLLSLAADWHRNRNAESLAAAHRALGFWIRNRPGNPNWWWPTIGVPLNLGNAALLLDDQLSSDERRAVVEIMTVKEPRSAMTGQNFVWMAENRLRRGLLARDPKLIERALNDCLREVRFGGKEGVRPDWCFHQHGAQPQFGNYGLCFLADQSRLAVLLSGTAYAYPQDKLALVGRLAAEGYAWICWKGMMDVSAMGRQLWRNAQREKAESVERSFKNLEQVGWRRPAQQTGFKHFFESAYAVYRTADWMASVRASTPRITGVETCNGDNVKGMCMADGALMTYVTGREYEKALPLWDDWRMIPGVTAYLGKPVTCGDARNTRDDIVAASEEHGGTFEFTFAREGLVAHKSYRFTSDGILCEGRDITATDGVWEVVTCVEHACAAENAGVVYERDGESRFRNGAILYTVRAPKNEIRFEVAEREGNYRSFMLSHPDSPEHGKVFSLRIVHGKTPKNATYSYSISFDGDLISKTNARETK